METGPVNSLALSVATAAAPVQPEPQRAEQREIIKAVRAVNGAEVFGQDQELTFSLDRDTRKPILKIVNRKTGEVVSQVPPEYVLRLAKELDKA